MRNVSWRICGLDSRLPGCLKMQWRILMWRIPSRVRRDWQIQPRMNSPWLSTRVYSWCRQSWPSFRLVCYQEHPKLIFVSWGLCVSSHRIFSRVRSIWWADSCRWAWEQLAISTGLVIGVHCWFFIKLWCAALQLSTYGRGLAKRCFQCWVWPIGTSLRMGIPQATQWTDRSWYVRYDV